MKNIRKGNQWRIIARLHTEVFVQHSVHDVQLPIPGLPAPGRMATTTRQRIGRMYYILEAGERINDFAEAGKRD
jgi:hypothetical protein